MKEKIEDAKYCKGCAWLHIGQKVDHNHCDYTDSHQDKLYKRVNVITISAFDLFGSPEYKEHPENYSELVNPKAAQALIDTFGEDSPIVQARIFGVYVDGFGIKN